MFGKPWVVKHLVVKRSQARDSYVPAAGFICRLHANAWIQDKHDENVPIWLRVWKI